MNVPSIITYILSLRYPGTRAEQMNWVCYNGFVQVRVPLIPPGMVINYTTRPLRGVFAWIGYSTSFGSDMVPDTFAITATQYGSVPYSAVVTQGFRDYERQGFIVITEQEPVLYSVTNISPVGQKGEVLGHIVVVPTIDNMKQIIDALERLHTSTKSEQLLQQAVYLLGLLSGQPVEPLPSVGES